MEQDNTYSVGDLVTFGDSLVGSVESYNDEAITVRVQAVSGDNLEPTDDVRELSYEEVSKYEQPSEAQEDLPIDEGKKVTFNTIEGKTHGVITRIDGDLATIEVYAEVKDVLAYEPTKVIVKHNISDLTADDFEIIETKHKLMCKFAGDISLQQDDEHVASFKGVLSSYGNVDLGGDVVAKGAYTQTLLHKGGKIKLFFDHFYGVKDVAGVAYLEDKEDGLHMTGVMPIKATDIHNAVIKMKFMLEHDEPLGLSIGYNVVKSSFDLNGNRILQELALEEASITPFPMDTRAKIYEAKARKAMYEAKRSNWQTIVKKSDAPKSNRYEEGDIMSLLGELKTIIQTKK